MEGNGFSRDWAAGATGQDGHVLVLDENGLPLPYQYMQSCENISGYGAKQSLPIQSHDTPALYQSNNHSLPKTDLHQYEGRQPQEASLPLSPGYFPEIDAGSLGYPFSSINPQQLSLFHSSWQQPSTTSSMTSSSSFNDMPDLTSSSSTSGSSHNYSNAIPSHKYLHPSKHQPRKVPSSRSSSSFSNSPIKQRKSNAAKTGSGKVPPRKAMAQFESALKSSYPKLSKGFQQHSEILLAQFKLLMEKEIADGNLDAEFDEMSLATSNTQDTSMSSDIMDSIFPTGDGSSVTSTPRPYRHDNDDPTLIGAEPECRVKYYCTFPNCSVTRKDCKCRTKNCKCPRKRERYWSHSKVDLRRHEEGEKHWPQENFTCLECPSIVENLDGDPMCSFCFVPFSILGEPKAHYLQCEMARQNGKTFGRKDHLCGHLREHHGMEDMGERTKSWSFPIDSDWPRQCGFCGIFFSTWDQRMKHIGSHFDKGSKIQNWKLPFLGPKDTKPPGPFTSYRREEDDDDDDDNFGGNGGNSGGKPFSHGMSAVAPQSTHQGQSYSSQECGLFHQGYHHQGYSMGSSSSIRHRSDPLREPITVFSPKLGRWNEVTAHLDTGSTDNWISESMVKRLGLLPVVSYRTAAGKFFASPTVLRDMTWSTVGKTNTCVADFRVLPRKHDAPFDVLLGAAITYQRIREDPTLTGYSSTQQEGNRKTTPPRTLGRSFKPSLALERYLIDPGDRVPALSASPQPTARESKQTKTHFSTFDAEFPKHVNQISQPHVVLRRLSGGDKTEDNEMTNTHGHGSPQGGDYDEQCAKDLRLQFESLLRMKRLNELGRLRSTYQVNSPQSPRHRTSISSNSAGFRATPSYASLRNLPRTPSLPADPASQKFQKLQNFLISLSSTSTKHWKDSRGEIFWVKSKADSNVKNSILDIAAQIILQHPQATRMRPEFYQRWWQNHQNICPGLSPHPCQFPDSISNFRSVVDICSALQFFHSKLSQIKVTDYYLHTMNYRPINIVVSSGMDIQGSFGSLLAPEVPDISTKGEDTQWIIARGKRPSKDGGAMPQRCGEPICDEESIRSYDLTKHEKIHSRPWKCSFETCKYYEVGWPTEKEMDRDHSDKHADQYQLSKLDALAYNQRLDKYGRAISAMQQEEQKIVVGIDFGTTYSGVAWANTNLDNPICVIKSWVERDEAHKAKVPTQLEYSTPSAAALGHELPTQDLETRNFDWDDLFSHIVVDKELPDLDAPACPSQLYPASLTLSPMLKNLRIIKASSQSPYLDSQYTSYPYPPPRRPSIVSHHSYSSPGNLSSESSEKGRCTYMGCGKTFKDLKAHRLTHEIEKPEKCPIRTCDYHVKGFARKYDKNRHTLTHYKGTMVCGFCPGSGSAAEKSFNRADVFKRHLTAVHAVEQTPPNSRKKTFGNINTGKKLLGSDVTGKCSTCSATFSKAQEFYEHLDGCVLRIVQQKKPSETVRYDKNRPIIPFQKCPTANGSDSVAKKSFDRSDFFKRNLPSLREEGDTIQQAVDLSQEVSDSNLYGAEAYSAPECYEGNKSKVSVKQNADIWSFGCILSEAAVWPAHGYSGVEIYRHTRDGVIAQVKSYSTTASQPFTGSGPLHPFDAIAKLKYQRPKHERLYCKKCNHHPDGFRGEHELRRHVDRQHKMSSPRFSKADKLTYRSLEYDLPCIFTSFGCEARFRDKDLEDWASRSRSHFGQDNMEQMVQPVHETLRNNDQDLSNGIKDTSDNKNISRSSLSRSNVDNEGGMTDEADLDTGGPTSESDSALYDQRHDKFGSAINPIHAISGSPWMDQWACPSCFKTISTSRPPIINADNCSCVDLETGSAYHASVFTADAPSSTPTPCPGVPESGAPLSDAFLPRRSASFENEILYRVCRLLVGLRNDQPAGELDPAGPPMGFLRQDIHIQPSLFVGNGSKRRKLNGYGANDASRHQDAGWDYAGYESEK